MTQDYTVQIWYSKEDNCYVAKMMEFDYCMAHGDTPEKAMEEVRIACDGIIEMMTEKGYELPEPLSHVA